MDPQQYQSEQQAAVAAAVAASAAAAGMAGPTLANWTVWLRFLRLIFPAVLRARRRAALAARQFYDAERLRVTGAAPLRVGLVDYDFNRFVGHMRPAYDMAVRQIAVQRELAKQGLPAPRPTVDASVRVVVAKAVADAGRQQVQRQVRADNELRDKPTAGGDDDVQIVFNDDGTAVVVELDEPLPNPVGWARVATGNETCAWCLMLVSRGPVYRTAQTAGEGNKWHGGCDCTVVPVFDKNDWPGRDAYLEALRVWNDATPSRVDRDKLYRVRYTDAKGNVTYRMERLSAAEARTREALMAIRRQYAGTGV